MQKVAIPLCSISVPGTRMPRRQRELERAEDSPPRPQPPKNTGPAGTNSAASALELVRKHPGVQILVCREIYKQ